MHPGPMEPMEQSHNHGSLYPPCIFRKPWLENRLTAPARMLMSEPDE
jgi:hypothetical protein